MKIRSMTCFVNTKVAAFEKSIQNLSRLVQDAKFAFQSIGFEVQSARLATQPFTDLLSNYQPAEWPNLAQEVEGLAKQAGFDYLSLGAASADQSDQFREIPAILAATQNTFMSAKISTGDHQISLPAIQKIAQVMCKVSTIEKNGFANLHLGALANVLPFTPFFPAAYAYGDQSAFGLAIQAADTVLEVFKNAKSLQQAWHDLLNNLENQTGQIQSVAERLRESQNIEFKGIDLSPAPFPEEWCSIGKALEALGLPGFGYAGTLTTAAFLADILQAGNWKKTGFNGIMLPVLEDSGLANSTAQGTLSVYDLLTYSAVCGTGLDTLPLPGDITPEEIEPLLLDIAALALRLDKPLTARLLPIPGKQAGEKTDFQFEYFANGRVLDYRTKPLSGLLRGNEKFPLSPRKMK